MGDRAAVRNDPIMSAVVRVIADRAIWWQERASLYHRAINSAADDPVTEIALYQRALVCGAHRDNWKRLYNLLGVCDFTVTQVVRNRSFGEGARDE